MRQAEIFSPRYAGKLFLWLSSHKSIKQVNKLFMWKSKFMVLVGRLDALTDKCNYKGKIKLIIKKNLFAQKVPEHCV
jgi:hypothetical protein